MAETTHDLSGQWNYSIITSEKSYSRDKKPPFNTIKLPNRDLFNLIAKQHKITKGYLLFHKKIKLKDLPKTTMALQVGEIMNTDQIYINGKIIGKTGLMPPHFRSGWSQFRHYIIPHGLLKKGTNTIDIVVYFNGELWFLSPIHIIEKNEGSWIFMIRNLIQIQFIHSFFLVLLSFSIFFFMIYLKRKKEIMYLYYSLSSISFADMTILQFMENLYPYIPLSSNTIYKICAMGILFLPPFLAFFFRSYQGLKVSKIRLSIYLSLPVIFALLIWIFQDRYMVINIRNIFLLIIPIYILEIVITSILQIRSGNKKGLILFIALLPVFIFGIYDILTFSLHIFEGSVPLYVMGIPAMLLLIGVQLINRFIHTLNKAEELNVILNEKMKESKRLAFLDNEIEIARNIQLATIPKFSPELKEFTIAAKYIPAENISGDFYNFHSFENNKLGCLIADVSGHGIPASLIASMVKVLFSAQKDLYSNPIDFISRLNSHLYNNMEGNFLTAAYLYIDRDINKCFYTRAGHEPMILLSESDGNVLSKQFLPHGRAIGFLPDIKIELLEIDIKENDRIILYTDGLTEACSSNEEIYGMERLEELFIKSKKISPQEAIDFIYKELQKWMSKELFEDDFTLIIIDIL